MNQLSPIQQAIWLDQLKDPDSAKYNIGGYIVIHGSIDVDLFARSVNKLVNLHDVFSFRFEEENGTPFYTKENPVDTSENFAFSSEETLEKAIEQIEEDFLISFNIKEGKLWQQSLIRIEKDLFVWYAKLHHVISDGFSFQLLFQGVSELYHGKDPVVLHEPQGAYTSQIARTKQYESSTDFEKDREFWLDNYKKGPELVFSGTSSREKNFSKTLIISEKTKGEMEACAKRFNVSLFQMLLAQMSIVFAKFYATEQVYVGVPTLGRTSRDEKKIFGPFLNVLPLAISVPGSKSFTDLIRDIKAHLFSCYRHQKYQHRHLLADFSHRYSRLYDLRFSLENFDYQDSEFGDYPCEVRALSNRQEDDPISIHVFGYESGGLRIRIDFNSGYVTEDEATELTVSIGHILENIDHLQQTQINDVGIASDDQIQEILNISRGPVVVRDEETFLDLWEQVCTAHPHRKALAFKAHYYSYYQMNELVNALSTKLQAHGVSTGVKVGVLLPRSQYSAITLLAILKSGGIYVPIDAAYPDERKYFIIEDCGLDYLIVDKTYPTLPGIQITLTSLLEDSSKDNKLPTRPKSQDPAYIIYTSGSTGHPKGVVVSHESLYDYTCTFKDHFNLNAEDVVLQQSSFSFDTSVEEIFPILSAGGTLAIEENPKDFHEVLATCEREKVTLLSTSPFVVQYLNEHFDQYRLNLRVVISGGDVLKSDHISRLWRRYEVYNTYGPTESTVCALYHHVTSDEKPVPIGRPITNRQVFLMNGNSLLPQGAIGEIVLGGKGVAIRYHGRPEQTSRSFTTINEERVYRTGDLGKWNERGELVFLGRRDRQLNFLGHRIEAREVEEALKSIDKSISNCHLAMKEVAQRVVLVAYLIADAKEQEHYLIPLAKKLPSIMIPQHIVVLNEFPTLASGKIDEDALPAASIKKSPAAQTLPTTSEQLTVANIWQKLLGLDEVDIHTNFFELGGHSLLANQYVSHIREICAIEITLRDFYEQPTIAKQAELLSLGSSSPRLVLKQAPQQDYYPLSFSQERLWFLHHLNQSNKSYNVPRAIEMKGSIDLELLIKTFSMLILKHETLRTSFPMIDGIPYQKVHEPFEMDIPTISLEHLSADEQGRQIDEFIAKEGIHDFDLDNGPLLRVTQLKKSPNESVIVFCEHHMIHDGWTQGILLREFIETYTELSKNPNYQFSKPELQFKDFAYWQQSFFNEERLASHLDFWKKKLNGHLPELPLPYKTQRPEAISGNGILIIERWNKTFSQELRAFSRHNNVTLFITMLTAFKITLSRFSGTEDITVGTAVANRRIKAADQLLGMVINTLVLRTQFNEEDDLLGMLSKVRECCFESYAYEDTPFGKVVEHVNPERQLGIMPLFQYFFSFMNTPSKHLTLPGLELEVLDSHNLSAKFDINVVVVTPMEQAAQENMEAEEGILVEWEYNSDIFSESTMKSMLSYFQKVLRYMISKPNGRYTDIEWIAHGEQQMLLDHWKGPQVNYDSKQTVIDHIRANALKFPDRVAALFENDELTYKALDIRSSQIATTILAKSSQRGVPIAVSLDRSLEMIAGLLAIWKTGNAYVPVDPELPNERIAFILEDCGANVLLTSSIYQSRFSEITRCSILNLDEPMMAGGTDNTTIPVTHQDVAYIIYTSGTTGKPKGVMVDHDSLVNRILWAQDYFRLQADDRVLQKTNFTFDVSVWEFFWPLVSGASLALAKPGKHADPQYLHEAIDRYGITTIHFVPPMLPSFALAAKSSTSSLRRILCSGQSLLSAQIKKIREAMPAVALFNLYGPTEATIDVTVYSVTGDETLVPIGKPVANTQLYVLDREMKIVPTGVIGELYIAGTQVARGYLNHPELSEKKFISDLKLSPNGRIYRTGDLVRTLPDGNLEFISRTDDQVKIRGFRIELGEIQHALTIQNGISHAEVVVDANESDSWLKAFVQPDAKKYPMLHRCLRQISIGRQHSNDLKTLLNGSPLFAKNQNEVSFLDKEIFQNNTYMQHGIELGEGSCVFDVGANVGSFSVFIRQLLSDVKIYAFEPIPEVYNSLQANWDLYDIAGKAYPLAVSDQAQEIEFSYYPGMSILSHHGNQEDDVRTTVKSYIKKTDGTILTEADLDAILNEKLQKRKVVCKSTTLSNIISEEKIDKIDLLKIDVENSEHLVISGLNNKDWSKVEQVIIEVHDIDGRVEWLRELLTSHGFEVVLDQESQLSQDDKIYNIYGRKSSRSGHTETSLKTGVLSGWESPAVLIHEYQEQLKKTLPSYMIPTDVVLVDRLPLTSSGKVDRKAMQDIHGFSQKTMETYVPPESETEHRLVTIWNNILNLNQISVTSSFFSLGGHSLLAFRVINAIQKEYDLNLEIKFLFEFPNIRAMAVEIDKLIWFSKTGTEGTDIEVIEI